MDKKIDLYVNNNYWKEITIPAEHDSFTVSIMEEIVPIKYSDSEYNINSPFLQKVTFHETKKEWNHFRFDITHPDVVIDKYGLVLLKIKETKEDRTFTPILINTRFEILDL